MREKYLCKNLGVIEGGGYLLKGGVFLGTYGINDDSQIADLMELFTIPGTQCYSSDD